MAVFHCKMCGGAMDVRPDAATARCEHCGTRQTLPALRDARRENLYDCAGHFLRCGDFDKADAICRRILGEDAGDPEAHWLLALCRYGVVYAEDPVLYRRVPVLRRTRPVPFPDDPDCRFAVQYAGDVCRPLYESAAKAIHEAQKKIAAAAQQEAPFEVILCCLDADASGRRTQDLMLANNLYYQLTREGLRVFFEHVTLSDRPAGDFEPYRFAALNSAAAMVVLGTRPEHFRALPVKDMWSRFLALMDAGAPKRLLPVYRDMDRYGLPEAFSPLRVWEMNEINFVQDLIREIRAPIAPGEPAVRMPSGASVLPETAVTSVPAMPPAQDPPAMPLAQDSPAMPPAGGKISIGQEPPFAPDTAREAAGIPGSMQGAAVAPEPAGRSEFVPDVPVKGAKATPPGLSPSRQVLLSAEAASLLRRALLFLEDGDWNSADEYCEKVLDLEPECAEAYVGKLMAELHVPRPEQLGNYEWPLDGLDSYRKAVRFANEKLRAQLEGYLEQTRARIPEHYDRARRIMGEAYFARYQDALHILEKIPDYKDAPKLIEICKSKISGADEADDTGGCFAIGCGVVMFAIFLFMMIGIFSVIISEVG